LNYFTFRIPRLFIIQYTFVYIAKKIHQEQVFSAFPRIETLKL
jgi:hypothetical protein